eukprot:TRINITY_DN4462_c0_g1_i1.p1 TRINITY_DN4462_c0_g1~~TRINITY_DN4462_c0_g1_i1.p1  ORF type:complete len:337 (-),score=77.26 TRINITY_DN4462_c0_g1_i1:78-1088(-)
MMTSSTSALSPASEVTTPIQPPTQRLKDLCQYHPALASFKIKSSVPRRAQKSRYSDFVLIPTPLRLIFLNNVGDPSESSSSSSSSSSASSAAFELDYDSAHLVYFSYNTINMLKNDGRKVYPYPLLTDSDEEIPPSLRNHYFSNCKPFLENEKQYKPSFHVVGHGGPGGVGPLDAKLEISPKDFAARLHQRFESVLENGIKSLPPSKFVFHTCNSAYVRTNESMDREAILQKVLVESYIGKFYHWMLELSRSRSSEDEPTHPPAMKLSVTGYRGFYCMVTTNRSTTARLQNSFHDPTRDYDLRQGEYTIKEDGICYTNCSDSHLTFFVKGYDDRRK